MSGIFNSAIFNSAIFNTGTAVTATPGGGGGDRLRHRKKGKRPRYWWENDELAKIPVAPPDEVLPEPTVETLQVERLDLGVYINNRIADRAKDVVLDRLREVDAFIAERIALAEKRRLRRIKKKRMLLLGS